MKRKDRMKAYLTPKYCAADGGEVPEEAEDTPDDESDTSPLQSESPLAEDSPQEAGSSPPSSVDDGPKMAAIKDYLSKQYTQASDPTAIRAAMADSKRQNIIANIGQGLEQMATARGVANGMKPDDGSFYQGLKAQGQKGVEQQAALRQQSIQDFLQRNELARQVNQDTMAKGSYDQKMALGQAELQNQKDEADPASKKSQMAVALAGSQFPQIFKGLSGDQVSNLTYADIKNIGLPATETAAKDAMTLEAARARLQTQLGEKQKQADTAFAGKFGAMSQAHSKAAAELDHQAELIDQAAHSQGGIAGNLVKGGALHQALGRVSQGELGMAVDPSLVERAKRLYGQIAEGRSLTDADVKEFQAIQGAARSSLDSRFQQDADLATGSYDKAQKMPPGYASGIVGWRGPEARQAAQTHTPTPPAGAPTATGKNGEKYVLMNGQWVKQ